MSPPHRKLRRSVAAAVGLLALATAMAMHLGWFAGARDWRRATGWDRIPLAERPRTDTLVVAGDGEPEIRWLGHAGFSIRWGGRHVLVDPNTSSWCTVARRRLEPTVDVASLGPVDAVLISHAHFDHLDLPTLKRLRSVGVVALPRGNESLLAGSGHLASKTFGMRRGDRLPVGDLEIVAVEAAHNSGRLHPLRSAPRALGYVIRLGERAIYYSGDTGAANDFDRIRLDHAPQIAILPIGAYAPRVPMRYYHLSPEEAVAIAGTLGVERVIPSHFGTFTLSLDRPSSALPRFAHAAAVAGLAWEMPRLLVAPPGAGAGSS